MKQEPLTMTFHGLTQQQKDRLANVLEHVAHEIFPKMLVEADPVSHMVNKRYHDVERWV